MKINGKVVFLVAVLVVAIVASVLVVYLNSIEKGTNFDLGDFTVTSASNGISIVSYNGDSKIFEVPGEIERKKVVSIGAGAFNNSNVTKIVFTEESKDVKLAERAFAGNTKLESVVLPANLEDIPKYCFNQCTALTEVVFPKDIKYIKDYAFYGCTLFGSKITEAEDSFQYLEIPDRVEEISNYAFYGCTSLDAMKVSTALKSIGAHAFDSSGLQILTTYNEDDALAIETIGDYAFYKSSFYSRGDREAKMPKLTQIGAFAFATITNINFSYFTIPASVIKIGDSAFSGSSELQNVIFEQIEPNEKIELGSELFASCQKLKNVVIADKITVIPEKMFMGCINLLSEKDLVLSESTEKIGAGAFAFYSTISSSSKSLKKTILFKRAKQDGTTENVKYNDNFMVKDLNNYWSGTSGQETEKEHFIVTDYSGKTLIAYVGLFDDSTSLYSSDETTKKKSYSFKDLMNSDIQVIESYAFAGAMFSKILLPADVIEIKDYAFSNAAIQVLYFNYSVIENDNIVLGDNAFSDRKNPVNNPLSCYILGTVSGSNLAESKLKQQLDKIGVELDIAIIMPN